MAEQSDLTEFVGALKLVCLTRKFSDSVEEHGFVLGLSKTLVLLQRFYDFREDGYAVLRLIDISSIRSNKYERKWEQILRDEGMLDQVGMPDMLPLDGISMVIAALESRRMNIRVECEECEGADESGFHIGRVVGIQSDAFDFQYFDATGKWFDGAYDIPFASVTRVEFDSPYINVFSKYLE